MVKYVEVICDIYKRKKRGKRMVSEYEKTMRGFTFLHCNDGLDKIDTSSIRLQPNDPTKSLFKLSRDDLLYVKDYKITKVVEINLCSK